MFEDELKRRLKLIFGLRKVTFDASGQTNAGDNYEQDTLFIEIADCVTRPSGKGKIFCRVNGTLVIYADSGKLPYGFYIKKISQAPKELTRELFFSNIDREISNSQARIISITERRTDFLFLYSGDYDPSQGEMKSLSFRPVGPLFDANGDPLDTGDGPLET